MSYRVVESAGVVGSPSSGFGSALPALSVAIV
jgi:hypothetical protein